MRLLYVVLVALASSAAAGAQGGLRSPADFLGYTLGERFTPHHRVVAYVEHVAANSPAVRLEPYGETVEGRPLLVAYVSAPENLARLDAIRESNLRAAGALPGGGEPDEAILWLSYGVHGAESSSTEAALGTLYTLANPADARTQAWLRDVVVVLDPCLNPDGREREITSIAQAMGARPNADPAAREHAFAWPGGRWNHYLFDLNRDWAWATQPETAARLRLYNRWLPHVHVDFHEQGVDDEYYFAPAAEPFHERITPWQRELQGIIGSANARALDQIGRLYFTQEVFDLLYPGYGDTWPTFNGAVGMTYEQAGSGSGLGIRTAQEDTLTLADRVGGHTATGLATVEAVAREEGRVREGFRRFFTEPPASPYRAVALRGDGGRLGALAALLDRQGIPYGWADEQQSTRGVRYAAGETELDDMGRVTVEPGDLVVPFDGPKAVLAAVLFEPTAALSDSLTYDVTAWALPYAFGLEASALTGSVTVGGRAPDERATPETPGAYAYLAPWEGPADVRLLARLLRDGVGVRVSTAPFEVDGRTYGRGSLVVTRAGNGRLGERFDALVRAASAAVGRPMVPLSSGRVTSGPDVGSAQMRFLRAPRVAVLAGRPVSPPALGAVWNYFDRTLDYPATLFEADDFDRLRLADYDVLVVPDVYGEVFTDARRTAVLAWVRAGGRLVAMEGALAQLAGEDGFGLRARDEAPADTTVEGRLRRYGDRERTDVSEGTPGAIYRVGVDPTHPLAFGYPEHYYALKTSAAAYDLLLDGWNVGAVRAGDPASGFAGRQARTRLVDTLAFGVEEIGRGAVVYLVDDPLFRGFWHNGELVFGNAVFGLGAE